MAEAPGALHVVEHRPAHGHGQTLIRVVLVHGSLDRGSSFARVVRRLGHLEVVTYDRRGYHRSREARLDGDGVVSGFASPTQGASVFDEHVRDLLEVVGAKPSVVVGHSFGGDIAIGAALASPKTITAVGAYEPPMPWTDWWPRRNRNDAAEDPGAYAESFFRRMVSDEAWERLPERTRAERRADGPALVAELAALRNREAPFHPESLMVPAVLGRGQQSVPHHRRAVEALAGSIPDAFVFEIAGAGHGAHLSHPDSFAAFIELVVRTSLEKVDRGL